MLDRFLLHRHGIIGTRAYDIASAVVAGVTPNEFILCRRVLHIPLRPSPVPVEIMFERGNYKTRQDLPIMITVRVDNRIAIVFLLFKTILSSSGVIIAANTCTAMAKP